MANDFSRRSDGGITARRCPLDPCARQSVEPWENYIEKTLTSSVRFPGPQSILFYLCILLRLLRLQPPVFYDPGTLQQVRISPAFCLTVRFISVQRLYPSTETKTLQPSCLGPCNASCSIYHFLRVFSTGK